MKIKGCRPFTPSRYITVVIPALLCLFLQNKYAHYGSIVAESQYGSKGCSRMLSESFYRKSRKGNGQRNIAEHNRSNDFANTSKNNHGEFNVRDLNDKLEDERGSKGNMVKHHKENKRTSVGKNGKRNINREQYYEEQEMYDEYNRQNGKYIDANHDDRYRNESYYGEPDMYNNNEEENIPYNHNDSLDSFDNVARGYSKDGRAPKRDNKNNVISEVNDMGNRQTSNRENYYETHNESSLNNNCPIFQDDVDAILEKLGDMVHYTDMINIFVVVNLMERNEFFDTLQSLMTYWNEYTNGSNIPDEYKHKQWLKVYSDMTDELMQKERRFYNRLYHIIYNTHDPKKSIY